MNFQLVRHGSQAECSGWVGFALFQSNKAMRQHYCQFMSMSADTSAVFSGTIMFCILLRETEGQHWIRASFNSFYHSPRKQTPSTGVRHPSSVGGRLPEREAASVTSSVTSGVTSSVTWSVTWSVPTEKEVTLLYEVYCNMERWPGCWQSQHEYPGQYNGVYTASLGLTDCQTKVTTETEKGTIQTEHTPISAQPKWPLLKINETVLRLTI